MRGACLARRWSRRSALCAGLPAAQAERIKDISSVAGVRTNQLIGYGLVVGLDGTGDQTSQAPFTVQSIRSMLAKFGVTIPANVNPQLKNVAAVVVTADLPPFTKTGQTIDITVASIGNAGSLARWKPAAHPLRGVDGEVYAMAQGSMVVSGFGVNGKDGSRVSLNVPSGGRIPNGATVEREVLNEFRERTERDAQPAFAGLHDGRAHGAGHQQAAGRWHGGSRGRGVGQGDRAGRRRISVLLMCRRSKASSSRPAMRRRA